MHLIPKKVGWLWSLLEGQSNRFFSAFAALPLLVSTEQEGCLSGFFLFICVCTIQSNRSSQYSCGSFHLSSFLSNIFVGFFEWGVWEAGHGVSGCKHV